ncbi:MAG: acetyl-CoA carboxylase biotin carboxyl carrier protein [Saprospiraceae bacterium]
MNFKEIQDLIKLINKTNLSEFKLKDGEFEMTIRTDEYHKMKAAPATQQVISVPAAMPPTYAAPVAPPAPAVETAAAPAVAPAEKAETNNYLEVKSPIVGTFYRSSSPEKPPYLKVGDRVEVGSVVCIVEAMKLFNEIESEISGKVVKVLLEDSSPVEYDQPLFLVDPNG